MRILTDVNRILQILRRKIAVIAFVIVVFFVSQGTLAN